MLIELLMSLSVVNGAGSEGLERKSDPQNSSRTWPADSASPARWVLNPPLGKRPFLVISSSNWPYDIAVTHAVDLERSAGSRGYYVAMHQTASGLVEADSRNCDFGTMLHDLRSLPVPEVIVPGTLPLQQMAFPDTPHGSNSITVFKARQEDGTAAQVTMSSPDGAIAWWVQNFYERAAECWKPVA